jgi:hypothetical protein
VGRFVISYKNASATMVKMMIVDVKMMLGHDS